MLCDRCDKRKALIHVIEMTSEGAKSFHLCPVCASKLNLVETVPFDADKLEETLKEIIDREGPSAEPDEPEFEACPDCGFSIKGEPGGAFLFGCERDFRLFRYQIKAILERIHGDSAHKGKTPEADDKQARRQEALRALEKRLAEAIRAENFELAAEIRDRIRELT